MSVELPNHKLPSWGYSEDGEYWTCGFASKADAIAYAYNEGNDTVTVGYCANTPFSFANIPIWFSEFINDPRQHDLTDFILAKFMELNEWLDCEDGVMSEAFGDADGDTLVKPLQDALDAAMKRDPTWANIAADPLLQADGEAALRTWLDAEGIKPRMLDITQDEVVQLPL